MTSYRRGSEKYLKSAIMEGSITFSTIN